MSQLTQTMLDLYVSMLRIRRVEEALADRYQEQQMRCPMHLCIGQEAIAAGVSYWLEKTDHVYSNHRAHGHYLAKGGDLGRMISELYGRSTGCCGGRGGSMHLIDQSVGFMGSTPIVGGTVPIAVGSAWAASLRQEQTITVTFFGDGCFEEGVVHESLNFAALKKLPIVFVCENNQYSVYTPLEQRQPNRPIHTIAKAHGLHVYEGDGNDVYQVAAMAKNAIRHVRSGGGPQFLEFQTHRWREHCGPNYDDDLDYRKKGELAYWQAHCPVEQTKQLLRDEYNISRQNLQEYEKQISQEISDAFDFALNSESVSLSEIEKSLNVA